MKREVRGTFTFTCGQHKVALDEKPEGPPFFLLLYGEDGMANPMIDRDAKPNGTWAIDLSDMTCPTMYAETAALPDDAPDEAYDALVCTDSWHVWLDF